MTILRKKQSFVRPSQALINFDYTDVASRQGYVIFDGFTDSSGSYHLSGDALNTDDFYLESSVLSGTNTDELGTFETSTFNYPAIMDGDVYIKGAMTVNDSGAGSGNADAYLQVDFYHNTTLLFSANTNNITDNGDGCHNFVVSGNVSKVNVKIGDTIKITITAVGNSGGYSAVVRVGCDPSDTFDDTGDGGINKTDNTCSTVRLVAEVPFKIDI